MKKVLISTLSVTLFLLFSCETEWEYVQPPRSLVHIHNGLSGDVTLSYSLAESQRDIVMKSGEYISNGPPLLFDYSMHSTNTVKITFSDGSKKIDFDCASFPVNSPYYLLCKEDTVSVFLKSNYWQEVQGIDTIYHYFIGEKDSLEAF